MTDKRDQIWKELEKQGYTRNGGTPQETPRQGSSKPVVVVRDKK
jgi:hypothetical protein